MSICTCFDCLKLSHEVMEALRKKLRDEGLEPHPAMNIDQLYALWRKHTRPQNTEGTFERELADLNTAV